MVKMVIAYSHDQIDQKHVSEIIKGHISMLNKYFSHASEVEYSDLALPPCSRYRIWVHIDYRDRVEVFPPIFASPKANVKVRVIENEIN